MTMQQKYPFSPIAGSGLGTSHSSLEQTGSLMPSEGFGGAKVKFFPNVATGNLVVKDRVLHIEELGGAIDLGYTYNSQAQSVDQCWHFSHKQFIQLPTSANKTAVLKEKDGHLTTYTFDSNTGFYFAPSGFGNGTPWLRFDDSAQQWVQYHPGSQITEYYNKQGLLQKRVDQAGRVLNYEYDSHDQLTAIAGQSGSRYEIRRSNKMFEIYLKAGNLKDQLLQTYQFDDQGRLVLSQTPNGYKTEYQYDTGQNASNILNIKQSDQTELKFNYDQDKKLSRFNLGQNSSFTIQYSDNLHPKVVITDPFNGKTQIGLDINSQITDIARSKGYGDDTPGFDVTAYCYNTQHQLETITHPNGGQDNFYYQSIYGVLEKHVQPNGQTSENVYQKDGDKIRLIGEIQYEGKENKPLVTRYTYDTEFLNNNTKNSFLRFKISPEGKVTEYRPDKNGNIGSRREYLGGIIDVSQREPNTSPSLAEMSEWVAKQDPQQVTLVEYGYTPRGQIALTTTYANVDKKGKGIQDAETGVELTCLNLYGHLFRKEIKQNDKSTAITQCTFDDLQRVTSKTDALNQTTSYQYPDAQNQVKMTYPNGRIEIRQKDDKGKVITIQEVADNITRTTQFDRDANGRVVVTTRPDGGCVYSFYDHQDRLGYTVTALGIVTQYDDDLKNRCITKTRYDQPIDPKLLHSKSGHLPTASVLISLIDKIKNPDKDKTEFTFSDKSKRAHYSVDAR